MRGVVRTLTAETQGVVTVRLDAPLVFKPGQAVAVTLPGDKKRFFSISSSPTEGRFLDLTIQYQEGHPLAAALKSLKRGDEIELEGPHGGVFGLPAPIPPVLIFIAAGIGIAPFRSLVKSLLDGQTESALWLFHAVRHSHELIFKSAFAEWSGAKKNFHYVPSITNDQDGDWKNEIQRIVETMALKRIAPAGAFFLLCGAPDFVKDMDAHLKGPLGVDPTRIRKEQW